MSINTKLNIFFKNMAPYYKEFLNEIKKIDYVIINLYDYGIDNKETSGDLDIIIDPKNYQYVREKLLKLNFIKYFDSNTNQSQWVKYIEKIGIIQIHLHLDFCFLGKKVVSFKDIYCNKNFININEEFILFCIQTFYKNKYNDKILKKYDYLKKNIESKKVDYLITTKYRHMEKILSIAIQNMNNISQPSKIIYYCYLFKDSFFSTLKILLIKIVKKIFKLFNLSTNDIAIIFIGVDGAGKSTTISNITRILNRKVMYKKHYFGLKTSIINKIRLLFSKNKTNTNTNDGTDINLKDITKNKKITFFKKIYFLVIGSLYWLEYNIRYLMVVKINTITAPTIHLIDRSYYDTLLYYNLNFLDFLFFQLSFKPDIIIYLTGNTGKLFERKKEISKREIKYNKFHYANIIRKFKNYNFNVKIINTTTKSEFNIENFIIKDILNLISKK